MDFTETDEHAMLRAAAGDVAAGFGHEWFRERAHSGGRAEELWQALAAPGFLSVHLPEQYGGGGGGMSELVVVSEAAAAQGCPLLLVLVSAGISAELLARFGTDAQRDRWLPGLCTGEKMVFAITEPDAGSNSHHLSTTATRDGEVYRLRGTKTYISGVDEAPSMLVVARTGMDDATGRAQLSLFVVDTGAPGIDRAPIPVEVAIPEKQFQLFFADVEVSADRLIGGEGDGLRQLFYGLNPERILSASICTGIGQYALERAAAYAREREVWGAPIGTHQGVAHPLARAKVELELARLMMQKAAWMHDHGTDDGADRIATGEAANMAKFAAAEAGAHCLDAAIQTHGGNGMATEYGLADLWGLVRLLRIAPVSHEMILNFVAQQSLGLPKSY
ncbi:MAG TPA: acyl-CoA dehydrogenase family protein [Acidimicrobiia bacterium]|nr:acyl-CoA dehydrogenase family protein [Acidimicrobiia bacterium]